MVEVHSKSAIFGCSSKKWRSPTLHCFAKFASFYDYLYEPIHGEPFLQHGSCVESHRNWLVEPSATLVMSRLSGVFPMLSERHRHLEQMRCGMRADRLMTWIERVGISDVKFRTLRAMVILKADFVSFQPLCHSTKSDKISSHFWGRFQCVPKVGNACCVARASRMIDASESVQNLTWNSHNRSQTSTEFCPT